MSLLKKLPIRYTGELHNTRLVNFTVDKEEVESLIPKSIKIRNFEGKALISMIDTKVKRVHMDCLPSFFNFQYRHIGLRLLVDDSEYNGGESKGVFCLKSFSDNPMIVVGGKILTNYNFEIATIQEKIDNVKIVRENDFLHYQRDDKRLEPTQTIEVLKSEIDAIDRSYSITNDKVNLTKLSRKKWSIDPVKCAFFETSFFKSAELQAVFKVNEVIQYDWLPIEVEKNDQYSDLFDTRKKGFSTAVFL